jgi:hypothetical protein
MGEWSVVLHHSCKIFDLDAVFALHRWPVAVGRIVAYYWLHIALKMVCQHGHKWIHHVQKLLIERIAVLSIDH